MSFESFEWLTIGTTAKTANYEQTVRGTAGKPIDYQDRLGAVASMNNQLEKSITSIIVWGGAAKSDYEFVRNHLAQLMIDEAQKDKKQEPDQIAIYHLAYLIARLVIDFTINPELDSNFTAKGRLYYAGIGAHQMSTNVYRLTWRKYECLMQTSLESAIDSAADAIDRYKKNTYKELSA